MSLTDASLVTLRGIAEILNKSLDLKQALHDSLVEVVNLLGLRAGWVFLYDEKDDAYHLSAHHRLPPALAPNFDVWLGGCQCNHLARQGLLREASNMVRCSRIEKALGDTENLSHHASVPLDTPRAHIGILNIASPNGEPFPEAELELLMNVGNQMAIAIERATLFENIRARRVREHQSFLKISNLMLSGRSFESVLDEITRMSAELFSARASLLVVDECAYDHPLKARCFSSYGFDGELQREDILAFLESCTGNALRCESVDGPRLIVPNENGLCMRTLYEDEEVHCTALSPMESARARLVGLTDGPFFAMPIRSLSMDVRLGMLFVAQGGLENNREDAYLLSLLANQVALAVEMARMEAMRLQKQTLEHELEMARDIQVGFLPEHVPVVPGYQLAVRYEAAHQVSGDFYDFLPLPDGRLGLVVADVAGKGIPAALIMAISRTLLRAMVEDAATPLDAVLKTNRYLVEQDRSDKFVSLFYGVLEPDTGRFQYVRAGHNHPMHYHQHRAELSLMQGKGLVLGVLAEPPIRQMERVIEVGDVVVFFTDGITEAMDVDHREFGDLRLKRIIEEHHAVDAETLSDIIANAVRSHRGNFAASDDFTLIVLKRES